MVREHWLDDLGRRLASRAGRRDALRLGAALLPALLADGRPGEAKKKGDGHRGGQHNGKKGKGKDPCDTSFNTKHDKNYCRFIRRQCTRKKPFCIVDDPLNPANPSDHVATCCAEGGTCCGGKKCCGGDASPELACCGDVCVNTNVHHVHCGDCNHPCDAGQTCQDGKCTDFFCPNLQNNCQGTCVDLMHDDQHCLSCDHPCEAGTHCCHGSCIEYTEPGACGGCDIVCPHWQEGVALCCNGTCKDGGADPHNCGKCGYECPSSQPVCCVVYVGETPGGGCVEPDRIPQNTRCSQ
jgi:hypothetical protein